MYVEDYTAVEVVFTGEFVSCMGGRPTSRSLCGGTWRRFSIQSYGSSDIHLCIFCTGEFSTDLFTEDLRFIWFPGVHEIEFVRRFAVILQIWAMRSDIRYSAILSLYSAVYLYPFCGMELLLLHQYPNFGLRINFESTRICIASVTCSCDQLDNLGADYGRQVDILVTWTTQYRDLDGRFWIGL